MGDESVRRLLRNLLTIVSGTLAWDVSLMKLVLEWSPFQKSMDKTSAYQIGSKYILIKMDQTLALEANAWTDLAVLETRPKW